ncbi:unnamed protein product [Clonostachys byssicola]|uniref:Uncharacterized protein n=1 Tax=Clonostachys byssicola TaxID=160290 RepID=A0A9N9UKT4_9HYPO|nr:unnamed protein product [Clonostachys byssicola]
MAHILSLPVETLTDILGILMPFRSSKWHGFDEIKQSLHLRLVCRDFESIVSRMVLPRKGRTFILPEVCPSNSYTMAWLVRMKCLLDDMQKGSLTTYFRQWASFMAAQSTWNGDDRPISEIEWLRTICRSAVESQSRHSDLAALLHQHNDGSVPSGLVEIDFDLPLRLLERQEHAPDGDRVDIMRDAVGALHIAAHQGINAAVNTLLIAGADPTYKHPVFGYPEDNAVNGGHLEIVSLLQKYGSTHESRTRSARLLSIAVKRDYTRIFKFLLNSSPFLFHKVDLYGWIERACERGNIDIIRELFSWVDKSSPREEENRGLISRLLCRPKPVESKDSLRYGIRQEDQQRPQNIVRKAIQHGHPEIVQFLIRRHEFRPAKAKDIREPLFTACRQDRGDILTILLDHYYVDRSVLALLLRDAAYFSRVSVIKALLRQPDLRAVMGSSSMQMTLLFAIKYGNKDGNSLEIVQVLLLEKGIDPNACHGCTPLEAAVERDDAAMVKLLLSHQKVNPNIRGHEHSPLCNAVRGKSLEIVRLLLERQDTDVNQGCSDVEDYGDALRFASQLGDVLITKLLLCRKDIDVNKAGKHRPPLAVAASCGNGEIISELLSHPDIDPNHASISQEPLMVHEMAKGSWSFEMTSSETRYGSISDSPLLLAAQNGYLDAVKLLLEDSRVSTMSLDETGRTPLWWAVHKSSPDIVNLLLEKDGGEQINKQDFQGWTPLHVAVNQKCFSAFLILLSHPNIEPNIVTKDGWAPLHMAIAGGMGLMVKTLLENSKVNCEQRVNKAGMTPFGLAKEIGNEDTIALVSKSPRTRPIAGSELLVKTKTT